MVCFVSPASFGRFHPKLHHLRSPADHKPLLHILSPPRPPHLSACTKTTGRISETAVLGVELSGCSVGLQTRPSFVSTLACCLHIARIVWCFLISILFRVWLTFPSALDSFPSFLMPFHLRPLWPYPYRCFRLHLAFDMGIEFASHTSLWSTGLSTCDAST